MKQNTKDNQGQINVEITDKSHYLCMLIIYNNFYYIDTFYI